MALHFNWRNPSRFLAVFIFTLFSSASASNPISTRPNFQKGKVSLGGKVLDVEVAITDRQRAYGLMHVRKLSSGQGMLFKFPEPEILSFWMKNTFVPLSIGFFSEDLKLIHIEQMQVESAMIDDRDRRTYKSPGKALFALEVPLGWFRKFEISKGAALTCVSSLPSICSKPKVQSN